MSILTTYSHAVLPVRISPAVVTGSEYEVCPSSDLIEAQLNISKQQVKRVVARMVDLTVDDGCGGSGWKRVTYLNMSDPSATCPRSWSVNSSPRGCGQTSSSSYYLLHM